MKKTNNKMKIVGLLLSVMMIVTAFGAFSLSANAVDTANTGSWGEYVRDTNTYTYADFSPFNESTNGGRTGANDSPYEISTAEQLAALAALVNRCDINATELTGINDSTATTSNFAEKFIKLSNDIDISGKQWIPIGIDDLYKVFSGNFDGAGYTVKGLTVDSSEFPSQKFEYVGLFGYVKYNSRDLGLGLNYIQNLHVSGEIYSAVNTPYGSAGGIVGYVASKSHVLDCHSSVTVSGVNYVGGVVGTNDGGSVQRCYNTGSVSGTGYYVGGVVGRNMNDSAVQYCYNTGSVKGNDVYVGGVVGYNEGGGTVNNCYYLSGCAEDGYGTVQNGIGDTTEDVADVTTAKTSAQFASGEVAYLSNGMFGQSLDNGETVDEIPVKITATNKVYQCIGCDGTTIAYTNDAALKDKTKPHAFTETSNGFCTECTAEGLYQPATDSDGDGYYEIDNAGKLYWFAALVNGTLTDGTAQNTSANAILTKDIVVNEGVLAEMAKSSPDPSGFRLWTPIGNGSKRYTGVFDGNGKTVSGLYFNDSDMYSIGMFRYVGANGKVQNVGVIDSYIHGDEFLGGVVGYNNGTVDNCYNEGTVSGINNVGGVVGYNNSDTVDNCYNAGTVSGTGYYVGGVVGFNNYGTVENCYNTGSVSGRENVGGVVGQNHSVTIENCYNTGSVSGTDNYVGGVVGRNDGTAENCYYLNGCAKDGADTIQFGIGNETQGSTTPDNTDVTTAKTSAQFASGEVAYILGNMFGQTIGTDDSPVFSNGTNEVYQCLGCDGTTIAYTNDAALKGKTKPHTFTEASNGFCTECDDYQPATDSDGDGYYEIDNAGKLYWFAGQVNGGNTAINGKLTANIVVNEGVISATSTNVREWTPIGNSANRYTGTFDGNDKMVRGLFFNDENASYIGFFGYVDAGGVVKNVGVLNSYIKGATNVGGVVGYNKGTVSGCYNRGDVSGTEYVGGVIGDNGGSVSDGYNTGDVSGTKYVGGVAGFNGESVVIENFYNTGAVTGIGDAVGGIVGNNRGTVQNCRNTAVISGGGYVGGVVGYNTVLGTVKNCYNTREVRDGEYYVGGVVGYNGKTVENCYNVGAVSGTEYVGGVVGYNGENDSLVQNCHNVGSVSGIESVGGVIGYTGLSSVTNCYYLDTCGATGSGSSKTDEEFESGALTMLLGDAFGQSLDNGETVNGFPVFRTETNEVYTYLDCDGVTSLYTNDPTLSGTTNAHSYENGFCTGCDCCEEPALNGDGYYEIDNAGKLYWFAAQINSGNTAINGKLTENIVINKDVLTEMAKPTPDTSGFRAWTSIGNDANIYAGTFNGNGKTVSGLYFNDENADDVGMFGCVGEGSSIKNLGLIDSYINGNEYVGGVVGRNFGTVQNCYNEGTVSGINTVGGVVGYNFGTAENCYNEGSVSGTKDYVGGVVGFNFGGTVEKCYNTGSVSSNRDYLGGVVGYVTNSGSVKNCYSTGSVSGADYAGGVVGYLDSGIAENCYSTGFVSGRDGVIGYNDEGTVTNCYYLSDRDTESIDGITPKDRAQFASGEVALLLGDAFGQSLDNGETVDALPVFRTDKNQVYYRLECDGTWIYSNSEKPASHDMDIIAPEHFDANGKCLACGTQAEAKLDYITSGDADAEGATEIYVKVEDAFDKIVSLVNGGISGQVLQPEVTLLTDLNDTLTISGDLPHFRLDLNGYDILSSDHAALIVEEGADVRVVNFHEENVSVIKTEAFDTASILVNGRLSLVGKTLADTGASKLTVGGATGIYISEVNASAGYCELFLVNFDNSVASVTFGNGKGTLHIDRDLDDTIYVDRGVDGNGNTDAVITVGAGCVIGSNLDKIVIVNEPDADSLVKTFDHEDIGSRSKLLHDSEVIIGKLSITQSNRSFTYNGEEQVPTVTVSIKTGDGTYYLDDNKHYRIEYMYDKKSAGEQGIKVVFSTDIRMNDEKAPDMTPEELTWIIKKAKADFVAPVMNNTSIFYNGTEQALYDTIGSTDDGTVMYKVNDGEWLDYIEKKKDAGEYDVYYKVVGDSNHNDVPETFAYTVTIKPLDFGSDSFMVEYGDNYNGKTAVYDGTSKRPNLKVGFDLDDDGAIDLELKLHYEYTDSFSTWDFTNAGENEVHLDAKGINFTGQFDDIITITPKPVGELQISHDKPKPPVYDGESHVPTVTVKDGDKVLTEGVDYEISWDSSDFIIAKTYTATITGIGNYGDTDTLDYEIVKAPIYAEIIAPDWIVPHDDITLSVKIYRADTGEEITSEYSIYQYDFYYSKNDSSGHTKQDNYDNVLNLSVDPGDSVYLWVHVETMDGKYHEFTSDTPIELKATSTSDVLAKLENAIEGLDTDDIGVLVDRVKALETAMAEAEAAIEAAEGDITALEDAYKAADEKLNELIKKLTERVTTLEEKVGAADVNNVKANADAIAEAVKAIEALEELTDLTNKDSALTKAIEALDAALDTLETKLTDALNKAIGELEAKIAAQIDPDELATEIKKVTDLIDALDSTYATDKALEDAIAAAKQEVTDAYTAALKGAVGELEAKIAAQIDPDELAAEIKKVTDLIDALDSTYATDKAVEDAIAAAKQEVTDAYTAALKGAVGELEAADKSNTDALNKALDELKALIKAAKAYADTQDAALKAVLDEDIKKANELIAALDVRLTDAEEAIGEIEKAIEELKAVDAADAKALEDAITALNKAIEDARAFATTSDTALKNELDAKIDEADKALEGKVAELRTNLNKAVEELKTADLNNASALTEAIDTLNKAIEAAKAAATAGDETLDGKINEAESALNTKIAEVQKNLDDAKTALDKAIAEGDAALDGKIADLGKALENAISAYGAADEALKAELIAKIEEADAALDGAIKTVQKNLDDAKAELEQAIADGDTALDGKIIDLNKALDAAKAALEAADAADKAAMTAKIEEAYAALDGAIKAIQKDLDEIKAALEEKNGELAEKNTELEDKADELESLVTVACSMAGIALAGCGALAVLVVFGRRRLF